MGCATLSGSGPGDIERARASDDYAQTKERDSAAVRSNAAIQVMASQVGPRPPVVPESFTKRTEAGPADPQGDWLKDAEARCSFSLNYDSCEAPPADVDDAASAKATCRERCKSAMEDGANRLTHSALETCLGAFIAGPVAAPGPECALAIPAGADPKGDHSGVTSEGRAKAQNACTSECRKQGAQLLVDAKETEKALAVSRETILSYKRCMLAVDRTSQASRYRIHDQELYSDLMQKTDDRCRESNRCDWLEKYGTERCVYGN